MQTKWKTWVLHRCAFLEVENGLNPTSIVEVFEPIQLPGDEFAPIDAVVKGRRVAPLASIVAGEVQRMRLAQVCWKR